MVGCVVPGIVLSWCEVGAAAWRRQRGSVEALAQKQVSMIARHKAGSVEALAQNHVRFIARHKAAVRMISTHRAAVYGKL